ncbi:protein qutG [Sclerotinia borealis F-4128]|uniref:Inositol-1-monophosphatase n=1 Tax=Sclerotinia borealis (strain F-4128) TaxID=1432307 RepID=W9CCC5_SCLBF|nr:protein qutG [Sclerotinia borealis F-4128]
MAAKISDEELQEIYAFALDLGRRAGKILMEGVEKRCEGDEGGKEEEKMNAVDIVTQTDLDVEAFVKHEILSRYPSHKYIPPSSPPLPQLTNLRFIGEESYSSGSSKQYLVTSSPTWIVDPLDGTVNYTHLFPMFCISIAFCIAGIPTIGVIYAPVLDVSYSALAGHGAWENDHVGASDAVAASGASFDAGSLKRKRRLPYVKGKPLGKEAPKGCTFSCEWGKDRRDVEGGNLRKKIESFVNLASEVGGRSGKGGMVHGVRSLGSATMDLAYTATGAFDIWWEGGCWEWDVAAGICILREAGGLITTANPPANPETDPIEEVSLGSRLYLAIRPAGDTPEETGRQQQERVVREVWKRVETLDYKRPGA